MNLESGEEYMEDLGGKRGWGECFKYIVSSKRI